MSKEEIRGKIDGIDSEILRLLNERAKLAKQVSQFKKVYYDPVREQEIFERLHGLNTGPLMNNHVTSIYREILSVCRGIQKPLTVAYLGPRATFSHQAAVQCFGSTMVEKPCPDISSVFDAVEKDEAEYGVVPFENSSEGAVNFTLDRFTSSNVRVCGEIYSDITLCLLAQTENFETVKRIYTQPKALEQCARWLRTHASDKEVIQVASTGIAAQKAAKSKTAAAVAGAMAADVYGLKILERGVEDSRDNATRFLIIGKHQMPKSGNDKTSVLFSVRHEPGTLYRALKSFEKYGINLTMIQARPSQSGQWEYVFFVDIAGHCDDEDVKKAIREMKRETIVLKALGSYPAAVKQ